MDDKSISPSSFVNNQNISGFQPSVEVQDNSKKPWSFVGIVLVSLLTSYVGSYIITWQSLRKIGQNDVANRFLLFGGIISILISFIFPFIPKGLLVAHKLAPGIASAFAIIFPFWFYPRYFKQWLTDHPNQAKFSWSLIGWGVLGLIIAIAMSSLVSALYKSLHILN